MLIKEQVDKVEKTPDVELQARKYVNPIISGLYSQYQEYQEYQGYQGFQKTIHRDGGSMSAAGTTRRGRLITDRSIFKKMKAKIDFLNEELKQLKSLNKRILEK